MGEVFKILSELKESDVERFCREDEKAQSLLYDIDLLPIQVKNNLRMKPRMLAVGALLMIIEKLEQENQTLKERIEELEEIGDNMRDSFKTIAHENYFMCTNCEKDSRIEELEGALKEIMDTPLEPSSNREWIHHRARKALKGSDKGGGE